MTAAPVGSAFGPERRAADAARPQHEPTDDDVPPGFSKAEWDEAVRSGRAIEVNRSPAPRRLLPGWLTSSARFVRLSAGSFWRRFRS